MCLINPRKAHFKGDKVVYVVRRSFEWEKDKLYSPFHSMLWGMVNSSVDNLKQSTNLSEYIKMYAVKKAEFNKRLKTYQTKKRSPLYNLLYPHIAILTPRVLDLKPVE